jgi:two-component system, OmpR family, response regulator MtrA
MRNLRAAPKTRDLVLVVDDDPKIAGLVRMYLERAGFEVTVAADGLGALRLMRQLEPALIVLDLMLPGVDGNTVARIAREEAGIPIVMLTALGSTRDRVVGLESGADDYVAKPFAPSELVARVRSVLRRARPAQPAGALRHGHLMLDLEQHRVELADRSVELSPAEFEILAALVEAGGRVVTRDQLINRLHPHGEGIDDRSIDVYIGRLRLRLGESRARPRLVLTVRGVGYRIGDGLTQR